MKVPNKEPDIERFIEKIALAVNVNDDGRTGTFTLAANSVSTVVDENRIGTGTVILWQPTSATAAAESPYESARNAGTSFTLSHASTADIDKTFKYILVGH